MTTALPTTSYNYPLAEPKAYPVIGHALDYRLNPLSFYSQCAKQGDFVKLRFGPHPVYFLNHPDLIKEVFVTQGANFVARPEGRESRFFDPLFGHGLLAVNESTFWRRQRRLMVPLFQRHHLVGYGQNAVTLTQSLLHTWHHGDQVEIRTAMLALGRQIIAQIALGEVGLAQVELIATAFDASLREYDHRDRNWLLYLMPERLPTPSNRRYQQATARLDRWLNDTIKAGRAHPPDDGSMLAQFLAARDDTGATMTDQEIRDELVTVLIGHDTVADIFCWAWWKIAQHPEVEANLLAEWQRVLGGRSPTLDDIPHLPYTEGVAKETLRLYPLAWVSGRVANADCEIAGHSIKAGENVVMCQWVTHRDRRFFSDPEVFDPSRWSADRAKQISSHAYFPFGGGARICIGQGLTMMEVVLLLAEIGQRFQLRPLPQQSVVPHPGPSFSLRPKHGLRVEILAR